MNSGIIQECFNNDYINMCLCSRFVNTGVYKQYSTEKEAQRNKMTIFKNKFNWFGLTNSYSEKIQDQKIQDFEKSFHNLSDNQIQAYADKNRSNFLVLEKTFQRRVQAKRRTDNYRNKTAKVLNSYLHSKFYNDLAYKVSPDVLGSAVRVDESELSKDILAITLSATDFGLITNYDFYQLNFQNQITPGYLQQEIDNFIERRRIKKDSVMNNSKRAERKFQKNNYNNKTDGNDYGATYWGTVWERKVRNDFAVQNPHLTVYEVEGKFRNKNALWQLGIVDGAVSDRSDGVPNAILEIKTSKTGKSWKNGIPQQYRAQALYYLHITGFEKAYIRVLINERETKDYVLYVNDEISVGSGKMIAEYIDNRLVPFLKSI